MSTEYESRELSLAEKEEKAEKDREMKKKLRDRRVYLLAEGIRAGEPRVTMKVLLKNVGMGKYYRFFCNTGFDLIEMHVLKTDAQCEDILSTVERAQSISFPYDHRVILWKMLRYRHFKAPQAQKRYLTPSEIPPLFLVKKDHRIRDSDTDFDFIDSERQRQVTRKYVQDEREGRRLMQLEHYERHLDVVYNLKDLQRCTKEWQQRDPKLMLREDPREEVMLMRIRNVEMEVSAMMGKEKMASSAKYALLFRLGILRLALFILGFGHVFIALQQAQTAVSSQFLFFFSSAKPFLSGVSLLMGALFCLGAQRRKVNLRLRTRLKKLHAVCKKLHSHIVNFRLESDALRVDKLEEDLGAITTYYELDADDIDYSVFKKKKKLDFTQWFARVTAEPFTPVEMYEELKESELTFPQQKRGPLRGGDRAGRMTEKLRDESNPHRSGKPIQTPAMNKLAAVAGANYDSEKELLMIEQYEQRTIRRAERRRVLIEEGINDSEIESSELHTSNQSSSEEVEGADSLKAVASTIKSHDAEQSSEVRLQIADRGTPWIPDPRRARHTYSVASSTDRSEDD